MGILTSSSELGAGTEYEIRRLTGEFAVPDVERRYRREALIANRVDADATVTSTVAGKHCESGDILVRDVALADPRPGDLLVTPATGAYGYAMANNYNGIPRPPVVLCADGHASLAVRRETYGDLVSRDV